MMRCLRLFQKHIGNIREIAEFYNRIFCIHYVAEAVPGVNERYAAFCGASFVELRISDVNGTFDLLVLYNLRYVRRLAQARIAEAQMSVEAAA